MSENPQSPKQDNIKSVTLRVAIFFGLTTFTLCIAIFYIESILSDTQSVVVEKDSIIQNLQSDLSNQQNMIKDNEREITILKDKLHSMEDSDLEAMEE